jgi:hypothetical protein
VLASLSLAEERLVVSEVVDERLRGVLDIRLGAIEWILSLSRPTRGTAVKLGD